MHRGSSVTKLLLQQRPCVGWDGQRDALGHEDSKCTSLLVHEC